MAPDMKFPFNTDLWIPLSMLPPELSNSKRGVRQFQVMGRLKRGVTLPQARAELQNIEAKLAHDFPDTNQNIKPNILFYNDSVTGPQIKLIFWSLMGAVGVRAADCLRQRRQPAAGAVGRADARDCGPRLARRQPLADRAAAARRKHSAVDSERRARARPRTRRHPDL